MPSSKKRKGAKTYRPRPSGADTLLHIWRMKGKTDIDEREFIAEVSLNCIEDMKKNPCRFNYVQLVDMTNILSDAIAQISTPNDLARLRCNENIHEWLTEVGHDNVAEKINAAHECLYQVGQRYKRTGSYALDGKTVELMEEIAQMYYEVYQVVPRGVMRQIIDQCVKAHRRDKSGRIMTLTHCGLNPYFIAEEKSWKFEEVNDGNQC